MDAGPAPSAQDEDDTAAVRLPVPYPGGRPEFQRAKRTHPAADGQAVAQPEGVAPDTRPPPPATDNDHPAPVRGGGAVTRPADTANAKPVPKPEPHGRPGSKPSVPVHWPRSSRHQETDTDDYNRDFNGDGDSGDTGDLGDAGRTPTSTLLRPDEQLPGILDGI
jgi:hypothetical protein